VAEKPHFQEYLKRFLELRTRLRDITQKELFKTFVSGLHGRIRLEVNKHLNNATLAKDENEDEHTYYNNMLEYIIRIGEWELEFGSPRAPNSENPANVNYAKNLRKGNIRFNSKLEFKQLFRKFNSAPGKFVNKKPPYEKKIQNNKIQYKAFTRPKPNYNQSNYKAQNNYKQNGYTPNNSNAQNKNRNNPNEEIVCYKCLKAGHKADVCYSKRPQGSTWRKR
jgi:hypothetical protein